MEQGYVCIKRVRQTHNYMLLIIRLNEVLCSSSIQKLRYNYLSISYVYKSNRSRAFGHCLASINFGRSICPSILPHMPEFYTLGKFT